MPMPKYHASLHIVPSPQMMWHKILPTRNSNTRRSNAQVVSGGVSVLVVVVVVVRVCVWWMGGEVAAKRGKSLEVLRL